MSQILIEKFKEWKISAPALHVVMGSGLSVAFGQVKADGWEQVAELAFKDLPEIHASTVQGHPGLFRYYRHHKSGKTLCFQAGRLHGYEGLKPRDAVAPVMVSRFAGTKRFLLTNAAGSLQKNFAPGSAMIISDHVNLTGQNPLVGPNPVDATGLALGPRFPDMSAVYEVEMREKLKIVLEKHKIPVHSGIYLGLLGPTFETPAEVKLFSNWGMGAVGMSTVWEAQALKHSGATLAGLSVISNFGCGLVNDAVLKHEDVEILGRSVAKTLLESLFEFGNFYAGI